MSSIHQQNHAVETTHAGCLGPYQLLQEIGRRQDTVVYKALDQRRNRLVALKALCEDGLAPELVPLARSALRREAALTSHLRHPGIVAVLETAEDPAGNPFIVLEFVEGGTLEAALEAAHPAAHQTPPDSAPLRRPLSFSARLGIAIELAHALDYMHSRGVVHRDLKPSNVLLTPQGHARIVDFGIAALLGEPALPGSALPGTPAFVAPELLHDAPASPQSDIFSFGVLLYWLFTTLLPFSGDTVTEITNQVAHAEPLPVLSHDPALPQQLDRILTRCLAKNPSRRYAAARQLALDLTDLRKLAAPSVAVSPQSRLVIRWRGIHSMDAGTEALRTPAPSPLQPQQETSPGQSLPPLSQNAATTFRPGFYSGAVRAYSEALRAAQEKFGAAHPNVADILAHLAVLAHKEGRLSDAERLHRDALRIRELALGSTHPKVATTLNNLALLCRDQGKLGDARLLLERSLAAAEEIYGRGHPKTVRRLVNLARLLYLQRAFDRAEPCYLRILDALGSTPLGPARNELLAALQDYVALLRALRRTEEATRLAALLTRPEHPLTPK